MNSNDYDFVIRNFNKHLNIIARVNNRKVKIVRILSIINTPVYNS